VGFRGLTKHLRVQRRPTKHPYDPKDCGPLAPFTRRHTSPISNPSDAGCLSSVGRVGRRDVSQDDGDLTEACVVPIEAVGTLTDLEGVKVRL
jgi:hypothetical protein